MLVAVFFHRFGVNVPKRWFGGAHLGADSKEELLNFGRRIGLRATWLQRRPIVHFDVTASKLKAARAAGAIAVIGREFVVRARGGRPSECGHLSWPLSLSVPWPDKAYLRAAALDDVGTLRQWTNAAPKSLGLAAAIALLKDRAAAYGYLKARGASLSLGGELWCYDHMPMCLIARVGSVAALRRALEEFNIDEMENVAEPFSLPPARPPRSYWSQWLHESVWRNLDRRDAAAKRGLLLMAGIEVIRDVPIGWAAEEALNETFARLGPRA